MFSKIYKEGRLRLKEDFRIPILTPTPLKALKESPKRWFLYYRQNLGHLTHVLIRSKLFGAVDNKADKLREGELERTLVLAGGVVELLPHPGGEFEYSCKC